MGEKKKLKQEEEEMWKEVEAVLDDILLYEVLKHVDDKRNSVLIELVKVGLLVGSLPYDFEGEECYAARKSNVKSNVPVNDERPHLALPRPLGVGLFGRLEQVIQCEKEKDSEYLKNLCAKDTSSRGK